MDVLRLAAFCDGAQGGNPAGVVLTDTMPEVARMRALASEVGFSETVFAVNGPSGWRVRYFSPEAEVPFCGHATIALGAALAMKCGDGRYDLQLNDSLIHVQGVRSGSLFSAELHSPPTRSQPLGSAELKLALKLFGLEADDLDARFPVALIHAGANHLALALRSREALARMQYDFQHGRAIARQYGWVTMLLVHAETLHRVHVRNAFAYGGVYEDPATGAAAAAWAGYLRDLGLVPAGSIDLRQGDDMGIPCRLHAAFVADRGSPVRVSGMVRIL